MRSRFESSCPRRWIHPCGELSRRPRVVLISSLAVALALVFLLLFIGVRDLNVARKSAYSSLFLFLDDYIGTSCRLRKGPVVLVESSTSFRIVLELSCEESGKIELWKNMEDEPKRILRKTTISKKIDKFHHVFQFLYGILCDSTFLLPLVQSAYLTR